MCAVILIFAAAKIVVGFLPEKPDKETYRIAQLIKESKAESNSVKAGKILFQFDPNTIGVKKLDSLNIPEFIKKNLINYRKAGGVFKNANDFRKIYGMSDSIYALIEPYIFIPKSINERPPVIVSSKVSYIINFDPNIATYEELISYGFNQFQAKNVVEYRKKGGIFKTPADLKKIYGIDSLFYNSIAAYIVCDPVSLPTQVEKPDEVVQVELNSTDSLGLIKLNGIGPTYARRILKYRQMLGGYYSKKQLMEVYGFTPENYNLIESKVLVDTTKIEKIRINFAEYKDFIKHPYFNKKQVEAILKFREKNGSFKEIAQIKSAGLIDESTYNRIYPYLTCR
jgi:DNA uptake protein ComE-like DNA-binding protein